MARVFVSYSSTDLDFAFRLASDLHQAGHDVWFDKWKITGRKPFWEEIQGGIESCPYFIFIISPASIQRGSGAFKELSHADFQKPKPIFIPVMAVKTPYEKVPMEITPGMYQIHDFVNQPYNGALASLMAALHDGSRYAVPLMGPPLFSSQPPRKRQKPNSFMASPLVRGCAILSGIIGTVGILFLVGIIVTLLTTPSVFGNSKTTIVAFNAPAPTMTPSPTDILVMTATPFVVTVPTLTQTSVPTTIIPTRTRLVPTRIPTILPTDTPFIPPTATPIIIPPTPIPLLPTSTPFIPTAAPLPTATPLPQQPQNICPGSAFAWRLRANSLAQAVYNVDIFSKPDTANANYVVTFESGAIFRVLSYQPTCVSGFTLWEVETIDNTGGYYRGWTYESVNGKSKYYLRPYPG